MLTLKNIYKKLFLDKNGRFVVAQFPNVPIIIWLGTVVLNRFIQAQPASTALSIIGTTSLTIWALLEIYSGVNLFRKLLGSVVLLYIVYSLTKLVI